MDKSYIRVVISLATTENDDILRKAVNIIAYMCTFNLLFHAWFLTQVVAKVLQS